MFRRALIWIAWSASPLAAASRVLIEDAQVRVVLADNEPGQKSRLHKHDVNRVMIHLDAGKMRLAYEGEPPREVEFQPGEVRWDPAGGMHTSENTGGTHFHIVEIEIKTPAGSAGYGEADPLRVSAAHHKLELDNEQVRVIRMRVGPGEKTALHEHVLARVTVHLTDQHVRTTLANGRGSTFRKRKGEVTRGGAARHAERNLGREPFEVIFVELKGK